MDQRVKELADRLFSVGFDAQRTTEFRAEVSVGIDHTAGTQG